AAEAPASVTNTGTVSGGCETNTAKDTANDLTRSGDVPDLTLTKTHTGSFTQGQLAATYTITVSNVATAPTSGTVTVVDTLPTGQIGRASCRERVKSAVGAVTCKRSEGEAAGGRHDAKTGDVER